VIANAIVRPERSSIAESRNGESSCDTVQVRSSSADGPLTDR
jgi:hypothetical protein